MISEVQACTDIMNLIHTHTHTHTLPGTRDFVAISEEGEDVSLEAMQEVPEGVDLADLPVLDREYRVTMETTGGVAKHSNAINILFTKLNCNF